jgi:NAD(P)-dependent dehydrogenase (short-subunit alcohol dehydrogenase family)
MGADFEGKVVIVTGAASGIGKALSFALAQSGATVVLSDIDGDRAAAEAGAITAGRAGRAEAAPLDVRDGGAFAALAADVVARHGRVDLLFNNAGVAVGGAAEALTAAHWDRVIDVNVRGVVNGVRAVYPGMLERGEGHIVNTASLAGLGPAPLLTPYALTKHAVVGLTTSLRIEAADRGVRVSALCPGGVDTPLLDSKGPADLPPADDFDARSHLRAHVGMEYPVDKLARDALRGVRKNRALIVVPLRARVAWRLARFTPGFVESQTRRVLRKQRAAR